MRQHLLIYSLYWIVVNIVDAQSYDVFNQSQKHTYITTRIHGGLVVPHHTSMMYFIDDFSSGLEITYGRALFKLDSWESYFDYPEVGLGFYYGTFGNKDIYGEGLALFPYVNQNIYRSHSFAIQNKVSLGLGYVTKPFDIENNTYNTIFSSHLNVYVGLGFLMDYRISRCLSMSTGISLTHLSNGAYKKPNHGINTLTVNLGTKYHFNNRFAPTLLKAKAPPSSKREVIVLASVGRSQSSAFNKRMFWNGSLSINHFWYLNKKHAIGFGFDQFYSETSPYSWGSFEEEGSSVEFLLRDYLFNGVFASYNIFIGKTTLFVNVGAYLCTNISPSQPIYPRVGVRNYISKSLVASFSVKASFFRSEFLEFGLGYRFNYKWKGKYE